MDHRSAVFEITGGTDNCRLAITDRCAGKRRHGFAHQALPECAADIEQRRQILHKAAGKKIAYHGHSNDPGDWGTNLPHAIRLNSLFQY